MTANLMNCWRTKDAPAITADMLLGREEGKKGRKVSKAVSAADEAQFRAMCPDTTGDPIWQKLEQASQRAEAERGKPEKAKAKQVPASSARARHHGKSHRRS